MISRVLINKYGEKLTVKRSSKGTYSHGEFTPGAVTDLEIVGVKQELSAREQKFLPEGSNTAETIKIYTMEKLRIQEIESGGVVPADVILYDSKKYQVKAIESKIYKGKLRLEHFKVIAELMKDEK